LLGVVAAAFFVDGGHGHALNCNPNDAWQDRFPAWSPNGRTIAFLRQQPGCDPPAESIGFVSPGEPEQTYGADAKRTSWAPPSWAPSSLAVAYSRARDSVGVVAPTGPVGDDGPGEFPSWAGDKIAFTIENELRLLELQTETRRTLFVGYAKPTQSNGLPVWSPDHSRVALGVMLNTGEGGIAVVNADGSGARVVAAGPNQSVNPTWSPDGQTIAFETNRDRNFEIYSVRLDGTGVRNLTNAPQGDDRMPAWHGNTIAFISNRDRKPRELYGFALFTMSPDGTNLQWHAQDLHPYSSLAWSPNGSRVAFASGRECKRWAIYVLDLPTDGVRRFTNQCTFDGTSGDDVLRGTPFLDFLNGGSGRDRIYGLAGPDRLSGDLSRDYLDGGPGADFLNGGRSDDVVLGRDGNDHIRTDDRGRDRVFGGSGNDLIESAGGSRDVIFCGAGRDTVIGDGLDRIAADCERVRRL
jgi:dipeptidyl aminopeptidase/acylaminoacyl peptidase